MNIKDVRAIARDRGISTGRMKKAEIIHNIQVREGNFPCFQTSADNCDQLECCWREDCLVRVKKN